MSIVIYSKDNCPQCDATCRSLDKYGISYRKVDVVQDQQARSFVMSLGYQQVPVVVTAEDHWSGFRPDKLMALRALAA